jgi:chemotaxis response regulator CheB
VFRPAPVAQLRRAAAVAGAALLVDAGDREQRQLDHAAEAGSRGAAGHQVEVPVGDGGEAVAARRDRRAAAWRREARRQRRDLRMPQAAPRAGRQPRQQRHQPAAEEVVALCRACVRHYSAIPARSTARRPAF